MTEEQLSQLMHAAQQGDAVAYTTLLEAIAPRVRRVVGARRHFAGEQEVEDLVQDVLLSIHAVRATYDPSRPFGPWLAAIIRNRLADGARRHARRAHEIAVDNLDVTFADLSANTTETEYGDPDTLLQAIRCLPPGQRQAVELMKLRGLSLKEAAAATGSSVAALKVATHRALVCHAPRADRHESGWVTARVTLLTLAEKSGPPHRTFVARRRMYRAAPRLPADMSAAQEVRR